MIRATVAAAWVCVALCGCSREAAEGAATGILRVTTTTGLIADAARAVGGSHVSVDALMGPGVDPHLYKASQSDLRRLMDADLVLYNGLHLEGKMTDVLGKLGERKPTVAVTDRIPQDLLRRPPEFAGQYDPHVWFDVRLWKRAVERVRDALVEADPEHRADYERNAAAYLAELDTLDAYARERVATIPASQRLLITAHDAFGYFGQAYGIDVMGLQGLSTSTEYGLQDLRRLIDAIVARKVKAVFIESSVSPRSIEALMEGVRGAGHEVALGGTLYSDALGEAGTPEGTYVGMVRHNVDTIVKALS